MIAALEQGLVGGPVVRVDRGNHALELGGVRHVLHRGKERVQMLRLPLAPVDGEEFHVGAPVRRLAHPRHVHHGEADDVPALLEQQGVPEGQAVHDLDFLAQVHSAPHAVGDAPHPLHHRLLLRLFERGIAPHDETRLGRARRLHDLPAIQRLAREHHQPLRPVTEFLVQHDVLGAVRVRRHTLEGRLVLLEEALTRGEELLAVRDEAAPRLHEPPVVDVLGAAEDLARPRSHLPLEEIAEGLLDDIAHLGEVAFSDTTDLDERRASLAIEPRPVHGRPHD